MVAKLNPKLNLKQREQLECWTLNPPRPYLRRKAWALLLLADGKAAYKVAKDRRVRAHRNSVSNWLSRYLANGLEGLKNEPGKGHKAAFSTPYLENAKAKVVDKFTGESVRVIYLKVIIETGEKDLIIHEAKNIGEERIEIPVGVKAHVLIEAPGYHRWELVFLPKASKYMEGPTELVPIDSPEEMDGI